MHTKNLQRNSLAHGSGSNQNSINNLPFLEQQHINVLNQLNGNQKLNKWQILDKILMQKKEISALESIVNTRIA